MQQLHYKFRPTWGTICKNKVQFVNAQKTILSSWTQPREEIPRNLRRKEVGENGREGSPQIPKFHRSIPSTRAYLLLCQWPENPKAGRQPQRQLFITHPKQAKHRLKCGFHSRLGHSGPECDDSTRAFDARQQHFLRFTLRKCADCSAPPSLDLIPLSLLICLSVRHFLHCIDLSFLHD